MKEERKGGRRAQNGVEGAMRCFRGNAKKRIMIQTQSVNVKKMIVFVSL